MCAVLLDTKVCIFPAAAGLAWSPHCYSSCLCAAHVSVQPVEFQSNFVFIPTQSPVFCRARKFVLAS